ncbi:related to general amino acid permease [Rhynchosporium secalis]|uniref:Related to general amino acid permease n=1 Tax=Rhynchosporium secalis TaxID=38038 RepID=A0A1E1MTV8_RHYSE|nr:related to general amino acid permease [Rhynchosporium secalis]
MSNQFIHKGDEESASGPKDIRNPHPRSISSGSNGFTTGVDDGVGEVNRALKHRHLQMIGIGGAIGTGLWLGTGYALTTAGPAGLLIGFLLLGLAMIGVMESLGEMASMFPGSGSFPHFAGRFVDPALGFCVGINYAYGNAISFAAELSACAVVLQYWPDNGVSPAGWISILYLPSIVIIAAPVRFYGESEFYCSIMKILAFIVIVVTSVVVDLGGAPTGSRLGFTYWNNPGPWVQYSGIAGPGGRFLGVLSAIINAAYTYSGAECVILVAGETKNPVREIPRVVKKVWFRILFFYILGVILVGMLVSSADPLLGSADDASGSPYVIAFRNAGIPTLPHIINAVILVSAWSAGNSYAYASARTLYSMALSGRFPKIFTKVNRFGLPWVAAALTLAIGALAYLSISSGASKVFLWLSALTAQGALLNWGSICLSHLRFRAALRANGMEPDDLPYRSKWLPYGSWYGMFCCYILAFLSGFSVFVTGQWDTATFFANYLSIGIYGGCFLGWKLVKRTSFVKAAEVDLIHGRSTSKGHKEIRTIEKEEDRLKSPLRRAYEWIL